MKTVLFAGAALLLPASADAQDTPPSATSNTPATDAVGPRELQNFSLPGPTTKPADQPPATPPASAPAARSEEPADTSTATTVVARRPAPRPAQRRTTVGLNAQPAPLPTTSVPTGLPPAQVTPAPVAQAPEPAATQAAPPPAAPATLAPEHKLSLLPWIAAALAVAAGTLFLLWRRRPREAFAGPEYDLFAAPEPAPAPPPRRLPPEPAPQPAPRAAQPAVPSVNVAPPPTPAAPLGIVATRLRPSLEIGVHPLRCIVGEDQVVIEFEVELFNAGTAPARAVFAEASLFNPGATQEQELSAFFRNPVGEGERLDTIPAMRRITLNSQVVAPRSAVHEYDIAGHRSFVPVIAFNALYEWSGGKGQTSAAYLVGRDTGGDKLGPLRAEPAPREIRGLGARPLPEAVRV